MTKILSGYTAGIIHREQYNEVPPRVEYILTEKGKSVLPILVQLAGGAKERTKYWSIAALYGELSFQAGLEWVEKAIAILEGEEK